MSLSGTVGGTDYSTRVVGWTAVLRPFTAGHSSFIVELENDDGYFNGRFTGQKQAVVLGYDSVTYFAGYLENVTHIDQGRDALIRTRISGRDYSQDLSNHLHSASIASIAEAEDAIADIITALGASFEITFAKPGTAETQATFGGLEPREISVLEIFREIAERTNCEGYVNASKALQFFGIGTVSSGIVIGSNDVLRANYTELEELDLRNTFDIWGARSLFLPTDKDAWTEVTSESKADTSTNSAVYVELRTWTVTPASGEYACPWNMAFQWSSDGTSDIRVRYQIAAHGWVTFDEQLGLNNGGGWTDIVLAGLAQTVTADANYAKDKAVAVILEGRIVGAPLLSVRNLALTKQSTTAYWASPDAYSLDSDTARVEGSYSVKYFIAASADGEIYLHFDNTPLTLKYSEYEYDQLEFICYPILGAGAIDYLEIRAYSSVGNYYYYRLFDLPQNTWQLKSVPLGATAPWASSGSPDWNSIVYIGIIVVPAGATNITLYVDKLFFSGKRVNYSTSDGTSQTNYRKREWSEILEDATLADITKRGDSLKEKNKDPIATVNIVVDGTEGVVGGVSKWLQGNTLQLDYSRLGISSGAADNQRMAEITLHCYPRDQRLLTPYGRHFVADVGLVPKTRKIQEARLREILNLLKG